MKKFIAIILIIFLLVSCWLEKQSQEEKNNIDKVNKKINNQENYILFWLYNEEWLDIKYEEKNIEKIKKILHKKNLSWINLENVKWNIKDILLLIKNNISKDIELSITLNYLQLSDESLSILMDYNVKKLWIMVTFRWYSKKTRDFRISKYLWNKIINRKVKKVWIEDAMLTLTLKFEDKKQLEELKNDVNFEFDY